jgi:hypothetical protein
LGYAAEGNGDSKGNDSLAVVVSHPCHKGRDKEHPAASPWRYDTPLPMSELFHGARLKIERAKKHIRDLDGILASIKEHDHSVIVEIDPDTGYDSLKFVPGKTIPEEFMCVVGDALHNLRTALDYVANEIEFVNNRERTEYTKFPVRDTRDELVATINGGFIHKAPKRVIDFIVDVVQPYKTGHGFLIWALHDLDIEDKHRLLIANSNFQWVRRISYKDQSGSVFSIPELAGAGSGVSIFPTTKRNIEITDQGIATLGIVFAQSTPLSGHHIFPTLLNLTGAVSSTVNNIEAVFLSP